MSGLTFGAVKLHPNLALMAVPGYKPPAASKHEPESVNQIRGDNARRFAAIAGSLLQARLPQLAEGGADLIIVPEMGLSHDMDTTNDHFRLELHGYEERPDPQLLGKDKYLGRVTGTLSEWQRHGAQLIDGLVSAIEKATKSRQEDGAAELTAAFDYIQQKSK